MSEETPQLIIDAKGTKKEVPRVKEFDVNTTSFRNLYRRAVDEEDESKRKEAFSEVEKRIDEAENLCFFNRGEVKTDIVSTLKTSTWDEQSSDYFYSRLTHEGKKAEDEARGRTPYRDNPRYEGIVEQIYVTAANQVSTEGIEKKLAQLPDDQKEAYLNKKMMSGGGRYRYEDRKRMAERARLIGFPEDIKLSELVGTELTPQDQGRKDYERAASDGRENTEYMKEIRDLMASGLDLDRAQLELMRQGYSNLIQGERLRSRINPEQVDQNPPPWFKDLDEDEQGIIRTRLHINYLAAIKRDAGMSRLDAWTDAMGLRIERKDLETMWKKMPGFRIVMATMMSDIFERYKKDEHGSAIRDKDGELMLQDHLVISGMPEEPIRNPKGEIIKKIPATGGYAIVGDPVSFGAYKQKLTGEVEAYLNPQKEELEKKYRVSIKELATAAVSSVDNFLFSSGAYDSGDEKRAISPGAANLYSEQVRAFFMPEVKGKVKWSGKRKVETGKAEEDFGGPLGAYLRWNVANTPGFKEKIGKGGYDFIPKRMFYSMFEHVSFIEEDGYQWQKKNLAQALLGEKKTSLGNTGLVDYTHGGRGIDWGRLEGDELIGVYADVRAEAVSLYRHLTSKDPKDRLTNDAFVGSLIKARKDPMLTNLYLNEDFVEGCIMMCASPVGLTLGTSELILNVDDAIYDYAVEQATGDGRIFVGMGPDFRKRLLKRLHAQDVSSAAGGLMGAFGLNTFVTGRTSLRIEAANRYKESLKRTS